MTRVLEHCDDIFMEHCDDTGIANCDDKSSGAL